jgi:hypothetical protein
MCANITGRAANEPQSADTRTYRLDCKRRRDWEVQQARRGISVALPSKLGYPYLIKRASLQHPVLGVCRIERLVNIQSRFTHLHYI